MRSNIWNGKNRLDGGCILEDNEVKHMTIQEQTKKTLHEIGIPATIFCRKMQISTAAYYRWLHGDLKLSAEKEQNIRNYIYKLADLL